MSLVVLGDSIAENRGADFVEFLALSLRQKARKSAAPPMPQRPTESPLQTEHTPAEQLSATSQLLHRQFWQKKEDALEKPILCVIL